MDVRNYGLWLKTVTVSLIGLFVIDLIPIKNLALFELEKMLIHERIPPPGAGTFWEVVGHCFQCLNWSLGTHFPAQIPSISQVNDSIFQQVALCT